LIDALREHFINWLYDQPEQDPAFKQAYDWILEGTSRVLVPGTHVPTEVKTFLRSMIESGSWKLEGPLSSATKIEEPFGCICFDAFSSKTSPDLWSEEFLKTFLTQASDEPCVLSTYACTGTLKRALNHAGFALTIRAGFANKRDSTFAVKHAQP
jgi:tRNA U34 5-methylaminomethyl-2-thiouridine-forming methyltransferase MnmC